MSAAIPRTGLADRFTPIIDELCRFVAVHAGRNRRDAPLVMLLCSYLRRLIARFAALAERGGTPPRAGRPGLRHPPRTSRPALPRRAAWLIHLVPCVGNYGSQLRTVLASEEFAALLIATPATGRLLRPLCRMFGIGPDDPDLPPALFHIPARPAISQPDAAPSPAAHSPAAHSPAAHSPAAHSPAAHSPAAHSTTVAQSTTAHATTVADPPLLPRSRHA